METIEAKTTEDRQEMIVDIGSLQEGDMVIGSDGKWHNIEILPIHMPEKMFQIEFTNGIVKCSGDHEWNLVDLMNNVVLRTEDIYKHLKDIKHLYVGRINGPQIVSIKKIKPEPVRCIRVLDSDDNLFEIFTEIVDYSDFVMEVKD